MEGRIDLHLHHQLEALLSEVDHRHEVGDGGIVDEDVDGTIEGGGLVDQALAVLHKRQVGLDKGRFGARPAQAVHRVVQGARQAALAGLSGPGRGHDPGALHGQAGADRLTYAAAGAGDQGHLALEGSVGIDDGLRHGAASLTLWSSSYS